MISQLGFQSELSGYEEEEQLMAHADYVLPQCIRRKA